MSAFIYICLLLCFAAGVPIAFSLGAACVAAIASDPSMSMVWIAQRMFAGINSFPYLALPFFILAGNIMAEGGISKRLVRFFSTLMGRFSGGWPLWRLWCRCSLGPSAARRRPPARRWERF